MPKKFCVGFKDSDGVDLGYCGFVTKEFLLESFPQLLDQNKIATLWTWGAAASRGDNSAFGYKSSPVQTIAAGSNWKFASSGGNGAAGIKTDGTLWAWGNSNNFAGAGDDTRISRSSPVQTIAGGTNWRSVSVGRRITAAIKTDNTLWLWGNATFNYGSLGIDISNTQRSSPVQTIAGGTNWRSVVVSSSGRVVAATKTDGTLWMWGCNANGFGNLGDNARIHRSSPVQVVGNATNWKQVAPPAEAHTIAVKTDGTLWGWGNPYNGELGNNNRTVYMSSPVQTIAGGTNWKSAATGYRFSLAVKTDGTLWGWGKNTYGQLSTNDRIAQSSPVQTIAGGTNWAKVGNAKAQYVGSAIKADGSLWVWGENWNGILGNNCYSGSYSGHRSSPVQVFGSTTNWRSIEFGCSAMAIRDLDAL